MKKVFSLFLAMALAASSLLAQEKITVSGAVTDAETGEPLFAVGVVQEGTTNGVISAMEGDYVIRVPMGSTLVFSSIGYKEQSVLVDREHIDVHLRLLSGEQRYLTDTINKSVRFRGILQKRTTGNTDVPISVSVARTRSSGME